MNSPERWLPILGYEGHYEVSDLGRLRSLDRYVQHAKSGRQFVRGRMMKLPVDRKGYPRAVLNMDGAFKSWAVHRAVMAAFEPRADWLQMHVNHKDGDTKNNVLANLEWCTNAENRLHSYRVLKTPNPMAGKVGSLHHNARAVIGRCVKTGMEFRYEAMASVRADGFKGSDVSNCINGRQKSHGGRLWRLAGA
jgi:hypothetical protein